MYDNVLREEYLVNTYTFARSKILLEENITSSLPYNSSNLLEAEVVSLKNSHYQIHTFHTEEEMEDLVSLDSNPVLEMSNIVDGQIYSVSQGLWLGIMNLIGKCEIILSSTFEGSSYSDAAEFIKLNGPTSLSSGVSRATNLFEDYSDECEKSAADTHNIVFWTISISLIFFFWVGYGPAITKLFSTQQSVFKMFLTIPKRQMVKIRKDVMRVLNDFQKGVREEDFTSSDPSLMLSRLKAEEEDEEEKKENYLIKRGYSADFEGFLALKLI